MTQEVDVPGVGRLQFPDGMSDQDMANAIKKNFPEIHQKPTEQPNAYREFLQKGSVAAERFGGGEVTEKLAKLGVKPEIAAGAGVAADIVPGMIGGGLGGKAAQIASKPISEYLMGSALKRIRGENIAGQERIINNLLEKGINVSKDGIQKIQGEIDRLNELVKKEISGSSATIPKAEISKYLDRLVSKLKYQVQDPSSAKKVFERFMEEIKGVPEKAIIPERQVSSKILTQEGKPFTKIIPSKEVIRPSQNISLQEAQRVKQGISKSLSESAYNINKTGPERQEEQARLFLQRGLRTGISERAAVKELNARESLDIKTKRALENRVLSEMSRNPISLGYFIENPLRLAAYLFDKSSYFKSAFANLLKRHGKDLGSLVGGSAAEVGQKELSAPPDR